MAQMSVGPAKEGRQAKGGRDVRDGMLGTNSGLTVCVHGMHCSEIYRVVTRRLARVGTLRACPACRQAWNFPSGGGFGWMVNP